MVRKDYYTANPTRKQGKEKHLRDWIGDEYNPQYDDDGMTLKHFEENENWNHKGYNSYKPKGISPYQALGKYIVFPVLRDVFSYLAKGYHERAKYIQKVVADG